MKYFIIIVLLFSVGCTEAVPPAHKGKVLTRQGYKPNVLPPGRHEVWGRDRLILIDTSTNTIKEPMEVILRDKMKLAFDVRARMRVDGDDNVLNSMFDDINASNGMITFADVYNTYGEMLVRNISRAVVSKYSVDDVAANYEKVSGELYQALTEAFKGVPIQLSDVAMGNIEYPTIVTEAVSKAKARQMEIEEQKAKVEIALEEKRGQQKVADADYRIRMIKAKTIRDENKIVSDGVTEKYLKYRQLEVQEKMAENKNTVFMPYEALNNTGAQVRMFSK